jgi:hypothetical protein
MKNESHATSDQRSREQTTEKMDSIFYQGSILP